MCGNCNDPFHGLDDDLDDVFGAGPMSAEDIEAGRKLAAAEAARIHTERCPNCRGTGNWRPGYPCFKCKGSGKLTFKTDAATRAKAAAKRAEKADEKRIQLQADRKAWIEANADDFAWMNAKQESFDFARAMYDALMQYGSLTERQHATVTRLRLADAERAAARKAEAAAREANAPTVDVALIEKAFAAAQANGIKRPRMVLDGIKFSLAPAHGRNAGALYVVRRSDDQYLGKIMGGRFSRVRECTVEQEAEIVRIASNPHAEAVAYGQRTGVCCICGRELATAAIDAGIGPICAEKYGWA